MLQQLLPFTVLKPSRQLPLRQARHKLQQLLPFTVLKRNYNDLLLLRVHYKLQQLLPFTVLKLQMKPEIGIIFNSSSCNSSYRLRY